MLLRLSLLVFFLRITVSGTSWGTEISTFRFTRFMPEGIQNISYKLRNINGHDTVRNAMKRVWTEHRSKQIPKEAYKNGKYLVTEHLIVKLGDSPLRDIVKKYVDSVYTKLNRFDETTFEKLEMMMDEMVEALIIHDAYHESYALWHYMHMREGLGKSRRIIREMFPECEKLAKSNLKESNGQRRREDPTSLQVLKDFMSLLKWLDFKHKLVRYSHHQF
ncbi:hypothetical protein L596_025056 [Steinernema carpocapsae]|uniref:Cullin N-terminal domain-containing protein n=1 Tax=Steinernema carpocapsae TaxID=34508 RepID=A0A4U5M6Q8_STECR|nr:hypothetical protein L596_025056 [Steinernema carpocapsae]